MHESLEQTHVWDTDFRVVWPDGSVRWLLGKGTVLLDAAGKPLTPGRCKPRHHREQAGRGDSARE